RILRVEARPHPPLRTIEVILKLRLLHGRSTLVDGLHEAFVEVDTDNLISLGAEDSGHGGAQLSKTDHRQAGGIRRVLHDMPQRELLGSHLIVAAAPAFNLFANPGVGLLKTIHQRLVRSPTQLVADEIIVRVAPSHAERPWDVAES